jgi:hypothetical protein
MTLRLIDLIVALGMKDIQNNGTKHNDSQHNGTQHNDAQYNETRHNRLNCDTEHKRHSE